jgi:hypothetical protein
MYVSVAVEGYADEAVARSLCKHSQVEVTVVHNCRGKGALDRRLPGFNAADSAGQEGPLYSAWLADFAERHWRPTTAAQSCVSLRRAIGRLAGLRRSHAQPPATRRRGGQE